MTNKNPYEVRLEILKMAQELTMMKYQNDREILMNNWANNADFARSKNEKAADLALPEFPSEQVIIEKARLLNEYISNNK